MKETTITKTQKIVKQSTGIIILLVIIISSVKIINMYQNYMDIKNYVEPYCAVRHQHDVEQYKSCKVLSPTEVLQQLKETHNITSEVPNIPLLGM